MRSIGEMTQISAKTTSQRALRGTAGCRRNRRIVVAQAGTKAASSRANPGGRRLAKIISATQNAASNPAPTRTIRNHAIGLVKRNSYYF